METKVTSAFSAEFDKPLDGGLIAQAVSFDGREPVRDGNSVAFDYENEHYHISFDHLPVVQISKTYSLDENVDYDAMRLSSYKMSDDLVMAKAFVDEPSRDITFQVASIEISYGHFLSALPHYLDILSSAVSRQSELYFQLLRQKLVQTSTCPVS